MEFAELAFQNIAGFPQTARLPLKNGLNAFVSAETDVFQLLRALFAPGTEDVNALVTPVAPRKIAITIRADDGQTYRLVRDLDAGRTLLKSDPVTKKAIKVSEDEDEINRALGAIARIPPAQILEQHYWLSQTLLPGRTMAQAGSTAAPDKPSISLEEARRQLPLLQAELQKAVEFEQAQDALYELQQHFGEHAKTLAVLTDLETQINDVTRKVQSYARFKEIGPGVEARIKKFPEAAARRDAGLAEVRKKRADAEQSLTAVPDTAGLLRDQIFLGGLALGVLGLVAAIALMTKPWVWLTDLVGFGIAAFGALRWVNAVETADRDQRRLADLNELEKKIIKQYEADVAPVQAAMQSFSVSTPEEVLLKLEERDLVEARRVALVRELEQRRSDPKVAEIDRERQRLEAEMKSREALIHSMGFTREAGTIRREIDLCEQAIGTDGTGGEPLQTAIDAAAQILSQEPWTLLESLRERLSQYAMALTDRRYSNVRRVGDGRYQVVATTGGVSPLSSLSPTDADLVYVALRLALAERVAVHLKRPIFVDEPSVLIDAAHRPLFIKMLRALGANSQIVVRAFEAPPAGVVDHVARAGAGA